MSKKSSGDFMKNKEKRHWKEQEKKNWKKKDIDPLQESKINLNPDNIMNKIKMSMLMKVKNLQWKKKDSNQQEDKQLRMSQVKYKKAIIQKLILELQDMKLIMFQETIINQKDTNQNLLEEPRQMKTILKINWLLDKIN